MYLREGRGCIQLQQSQKKSADTGDTGVLIKAIAFAAEKHRRQRRRDAEASPYINHPIALANLLANEGGIADLSVLCAAILHDTVEDTETTEAELEQLFGGKVKSIVMEVTDDPSLKKTEQKQRQIDRAPHMSPEAKLVKLADKICNLKDVLDAPPTSWSTERKQIYVDQGIKVVAGLRGIHPGLESIFDGLVQRHKDRGETHAG
jgi:guanosine-3',5'-bis(diphosphate) 3'-pyrophosphohydrolase